MAKGRETCFWFIDVNCKQIMKSILLLFSVILIVVSCNSPREQEVDADKIYVNGKIYTVNAAQPWAEAVAIRGGKFLKVGSTEEINGLAGNETEIIDLEGRFVMPGIVDMHAHPLSAADYRGELGLSLKNRTNVDSILAEVKLFTESHPEKTGIIGGDWNLGVFPGDSPDKRLLDAVVPDRPVYLLSQSGHMAWVNSRALEVAGINEEFVDKGAVKVDRYPGTNEPSGTVRELAMPLVLSAIGFGKADEVAAEYRDVFAEYSKYGVTAIQPAEGAPNWLRAAAILEENKELNFRLFPAMDWITSQSRAESDDEVIQNIQNWKEYETELIHPHYVKMFSDGGPDSRTCLLLEPYEGTDQTGALYIDKENFEEGIKRYYSQGIGLHVHCICDGTAEVIIEIFEQAANEFPESNATLHLAHGWMTNTSQLERLAKIPNATIDFSPMLAIPAPSLQESFVSPIGEERYQKFFNVRHALDLGIPVGFGSDFPSSLIPEPNQFWYMEGWVTRQFPEHPEYGSLNPSQAISIEQAIYGFTLGGAEALGFDYSSQFGSIKEGKSADMIVLDQNLIEISSDQIHNTHVLSTVFQGKEVHSR